MAACTWAGGAGHRQLRVVRGARGVERAGPARGAWPIVSPTHTLLVTVLTRAIEGLVGQPISVMWSTFGRALPVHL